MSPFISSFNFGLPSSKRVPLLIFKNNAILPGLNHPKIRRNKQNTGQVEEEAGRMDIARRQLEEEVVRLQVSIREKDKDLQVCFKRNYEVYIWFEIY